MPGDTTYAQMAMKAAELAAVQDIKATGYGDSAQYRIMAAAEREIARTYALVSIAESQTILLATLEILLATLDKIADDISNIADILNGTTTYPPKKEV